MDLKTIKMFLPMAGMLAISKSGIDLQKPENVVIIRMAFASGVTLVLTMAALVYAKLKSKKDNTIITVETKANPFGDPADVKKEKMTVSAYDAQELSKLLKQTCMQTCIMAGVHWKWGTTQPLVFQAVMQPLNMATHPLFRLHVLGEQSEATARPFKDETPAFLKPPDAPAPITAQDDAAEEEEEEAEAEVVPSKAPALKQRKPEPKPEPKKKKVATTKEEQALEDLKDELSKDK